MTGFATGETGFDSCKRQAIFFIFTSSIPVVWLFFLGKRGRNLKMTAVSPFKVYCLSWHRHDFTVVYLEAFTAGWLGMPVFWGLTLRRLASSSWSFEGSCRHHYKERNFRSKRRTPRSNVTTRTTDVFNFAFTLWVQCELQNKQLLIFYVFFDRVS